MICKNPVASKCISYAVILHPLFGRFGCLNLVANNVRCSSCRDASAMKSISSNSTFSELFGLRLICDVSIAKLWCVEVLFFRVDFFLSNCCFDLCMQMRRESCICSCKCVGFIYLRRLMRKFIF